MTRENVTLAELIAALLDEGMSPEDAVKAARATFRVQQGSITKQSPSDQRFISVQGDGRGVDYGEETPAQAKERWLQQEMQDPQGLFQGGSTAGGVFGDGPIATDQVDPSAFARTANLKAQLGQLRTQEQMVQLMQELTNELRGGRDQPRKELPEEPRPSRLLGRKKRRRGR